MSCSDCETTCSMFLGSPSIHPCKHAHITALVRYLDRF
jgi:hypothetical protein